LIEIRKEAEAKARHRLRLRAPERDFMGKASSGDENDRVDMRAPDVR
jgi:hypothetical protein